jgi:hypothetical protein
MENAKPADAEHAQITAISEDRMTKPDKDPVTPAEPTEAQLWSRLRRLKQRRERINSEIDAEIAQIKSTLGNALSEQ